MTDNFNGGDEPLSQWFSMNPNQQQQTDSQQYQGRPEQLIQAPMIDDRNIFNTETATQQSQTEGGSMGHQIFYPPPQFADQSQSPAHPAEMFQQVYQQRGLIQQQTSPQQYQQQQQSYSEQQQVPVLSMDLPGGNSSAMDNSRGSENLYFNYDAGSSQQQDSIQNSPLRIPHAQRNISNQNIVQAQFVAGNRSLGNTGTNATKASIALSKAKLRSERKRTREKQRRDGVNRQFSELTKVLKRLELEEREEADRKTRLANGSDSSRSASLHSVRLPFIAPNNSVDLISCAIVHLQHLHRLSQRQQEDINRLEESLENTKKAGEDTASKLKEVLFNYQVPRPHLGLTNPSFNVGNTSISRSSNNISNTISIMGTNNSSNSNNRGTNITVTGNNRNGGDSKLIMNRTTSTQMSMDPVVTGGSQEKQQQVMMMVPVMMNMNGTSTIMGQGTAVNMPGMGIQTMSASSSSNTNPYPSATPSAATAYTSIGNVSSSNPIPPKPSPQQRPIHQAQPMQEPTPHQVTSQQQQNPPPRQTTTNGPTAAPSNGPSHFQQQKGQQQMVVQPRNHYLERHSQPMSRAPSQDPGASGQQQQQQQLVVERSQPKLLASSPANAAKEGALIPQNPVAESRNTSAPSRVFEVALATALSNFRGGRTDDEEDQQQSQQQQAASRVAVTSELSHNSSTSDHAAALGSAIVPNPMLNLAPNPSAMVAASTNSTGTDNVDGREDYPASQESS